MTTLTPKGRRKNIVIVRAGDDSLHKGWIARSSRDFDLFISYYGKQPNMHRTDAEFYEMRPGPKWPCIAQLLAEHPTLLQSYDAFWFPDDDISASTEILNRMFALFHAFQLSLAQPALTRDSYYSWKPLLQDSRYILRHSRFVEVMAPIFDRGALLACKASFDESRSGWGLDCVWPELCGKGRPDSIAILDATPVRHTRPLGGNLYSNNPDLNPAEDARRVIAKYELQKKSSLVKYQGFHSAVRHVQRPLMERMLMWLQTLNALRRYKRQTKRTPKVR